MHASSSNERSLQEPGSDQQGQSGERETQGGCNEEVVACDTDSDQDATTELYSAFTGRKPTLNFAPLPPFTGP